MRFLTIGLTGLLVASCQANGTEDAAALADPTVAAAEPPDYVTAICGDCHAVKAGAISPNPQAPGFADIANSPGVTRETMVTFLSDAHNYPLQMDVDLAPEDIDLIADHMMDLQSEDYFKTPS